MASKTGKLELTWVNKEQRPRLEPRLLLEDPSKSYGDPASPNMLIRGDNLLALKALEQDFAGQVKCGYIDPPYNTGSAFEHYDDGLEHSIWLSMMRERLELLWRFLRPDGSLWVSIDDYEMPYLRLLLNEICGRERFIASVVWQKRYSRENREAIGDVHEYLVVYAVNPQKFKETRNRIPLTGPQAKVYRNPNKDPRGRWRGIPMTAQEGHATPEQFYEITAPSGKIFTPSEGRCWSLSKKTFEKLRAEGRIYFGTKGNSQPNVIRYLSEVEGIVPWTWWPHEEVGHTDEAKKEIYALFGKENAFDTPKPERLIKRVFEIASNEEDLVLDSFLGTGTSAAVAMKMGRHFIGVEMNQQAETLCLPRLRKVVDGTDAGGVSDATGWKGGGGFKFFELAESLLVKDKALDVFYVNPKYNADMLIRAICKVENFRYRPRGRWHGYSSESHFIHVVTQILNQPYLDMLAADLGEQDALLVYCTKRNAGLNLPPNVKIKRIPKDMLAKCEFRSDLK
jgi:adenine-specific DNA-methyltransferase